MAQEPPPAEANEVPNEGETKAKTPWVPLILVLLFIPIITLALVEFVVVPKLKTSMAGEVTSDGQGTSAEVTTEGGHGGEDGHGGGEAGGGGSATATQVTFEGVVTNIAGTMGTRFLKVSFLVEGTDPKLAGMVMEREPMVKDAIISTLSSRTIPELEAAGGRNSLRVGLISAINGALGLNLVKELYFLEFIIQ